MKAAIQSYPRDGLTRSMRMARDLICCAVLAAFGVYGTAILAALFEDAVGDPLIRRSDYVATLTTLLGGLTKDLLMAVFGVWLGLRLSRLGDAGKRQEETLEAFERLLESFTRNENYIGETLEFMKGAREGRYAVSTFKLDVVTLGHFSLKSAEYTNDSTLRACIIGLRFELEHLNERLETYRQFLAVSAALKNLNHDMLAQLRDGYFKLSDSTLRHIKEAREKVEKAKPRPTIWTRQWRLLPR